MRYVINIANNQGITSEGYDSKSSSDEIHYGFLDLSSKKNKSYYCYTYGGSTLLQKYNALTYSTKKVADGSYANDKNLDSKTKDIIKGMASNYKNALKNFKNLKIDYLVLQEKYNYKEDITKIYDGAQKLLSLLYNVNSDGIATQNKDMKIYLKNRWGYTGTKYKDISPLTPATENLNEVKEQLNEYIKKIGANGETKIINDGQVVKDLSLRYLGYNEANNTVKEKYYKTFFEDLNGHPSPFTAYIVALAANKAMFNIDIDQVTYVPISLDGGVKVFRNGKEGNAKKETILKTAKNLINTYVSGDSITEDGSI